MTSSGTYTFGTNTDAFTLLTEAWERVGKERSQLSANDFDSARRSLNYSLSEAGNRGINLWTVELLSFPLVQAQATVTLNTQNIEVLQAYIRQTVGSAFTDYIIGPISRAEYDAQPNKTQQAGRPTQFYLDRQITPIVYPWPLPQDSTCTLYCHVLNAVEDVGAYTNTLDAPQRWWDWMAAATAARLAVKWAPERATLLDAKAEIAFQYAAAEDTENVPMRIVPSTLGRRFG